MGNPPFGGQRRLRLPGSRRGGRSERGQMRLVEICRRGRCAPGGWAGWPTAMAATVRKPWGSWSSSATRGSCCRAWLRPKRYHAGQIQVGGGEHHVLHHTAGVGTGDDLLVLQGVADIDQSGGVVGGIGVGIAHRLLKQLVQFLQYRRVLDHRQMQPLEAAHAGGGRPWRP